VEVNLNDEKLIQQVQSKDILDEIMKLKDIDGMVKLRLSEIVKS
jgi:hypothetical protein